MSIAASALAARPGEAPFPGAVSCPPGRGGGARRRLMAAARWLRAALAAPAALLSARHGARPVPAAGLSPADAARFRAVMLPHLDAAYNFARYLCRDGDAAQDIVQDAFLRAYRGFADFRGASPRAWLLAIVRNCHHDWRGRARRHPEAPPRAAQDEAAEETALLVEAETPESLLLRRSEAEAVRHVLQSLPEPLREALVLRELDELSYREIAEVAGVPVGTVMSRLSRARRQFAELWTRAEAARTQAERAPARGGRP